MEKKIRVAFIYKASNIFMTGKHFDNVYYNFFLKALTRNNRITVKYFHSEKSFDTRELKGKFDVILLWQNNEFGTPDLLGINELTIPIISRCADPREAKKTIEYHEKWKIDFYFHFWSERFFHSFLPNVYKYKSIIFGLETSLYQNIIPFNNRINNRILNSGAVGNTKIISRVINSIKNPKWNSLRIYYLRTMCNKLPYVDYTSTLKHDFVNDRYPKLLQKYSSSIAANSLCTVAKMWEIPAAGCLCFLEVNERNDVKELGFIDGQSAIFINEKNYKKKFEEFLSSTDDPKWKDIANNGRKYAIENLNNDKAVDSLVDLMESLMK